MRRTVLLVALTFSMCLLFASCEKEGASSMVGTWSFVEEGKANEGDYVVIEDNLISFYYGKEDGFDNGVKYKFEYEHPHIFIAGINSYDVVSKSQNSMIWEGVPMGSYTQRERFILTKVDESAVKSLIGEWRFKTYWAQYFNGYGWGEWELTFTGRSVITAKTITDTYLERNDNGKITQINDVMTFTYVYSEPYLTLQYEGKPYGYPNYKVSFTGKNTMELTYEEEGETKYRAVYERI